MSTLATTTRDVFRAVDPSNALSFDDDRYVDLTEARGNEDVISELFDTIEWSEERTAQLFTGHRGCGKSTELLRLKERLEKADFAIVYFEADDILDLNDISYTDILLAIARQVHSGFQEMGLALDDSLMEEIFKWFAEVVEERTDYDDFKAELESEFRFETPKLLSPFAHIMARLTGQIRTGVESKRQVRRQLDPQISQLIDTINLLLQSGTEALRKQGKRGLVIVIDNLDRISLRQIDDGQRNSHEALYIDHGEQLRALACDMIYTVPISMFYSSRASILRGIFPDHVIVPMIKVRTKTGQEWAEGIETLRRILGKRIDLDEIFEKQALHDLCTISGGHPRDLMILVRSASRYAKNRAPKPIDAAAAEKAISRLVSEYSRMIPEAHFALLADVRRTKEVQNDDAHQEMLHNLSVLEYINGAPPWHDVHPVILQIPKFQEAWDHGKPNFA